MAQVAPAWPDEAKDCEGGNDSLDYKLAGLAEKPPLPPGGLDEDHITFDEKELLAVKSAASKERPQSRESERLARVKSSARVFGYRDPEEIKQKVLDGILKPDPYSVFDYYKTDGPWQWLAKHPLFENITLAVISLNALYIWIDTDFNKDDIMTPTKTRSLAEAGWFFVFMEHAFCAYFTGEWIVRFAAFEIKRNGLKDAWFVFDSILVFMMVMETWVLTIVMGLAGGGSSPFGGSSGILRLFRLLRLSRLLRMLRSLPELMILIKGMLSAMTSVFYVMCLLVLITYVFAIAFTQVAVGTESIGDEFFSNVPLAMYSLLIHATFLDDLAGFMNALRRECWPLLVLALVFIYFAALTVMNMLIGVLCEVVSAVAASEKEESSALSVTEQLHSIASALDANFDNKISYEEFAHIIEKPEALKSLQSVGISPVGLVDFAELFFFEDGNPVELSFDEFMAQVLCLRESNTATVKDVLNVWMQIKTTTNRQIKELRESVDSRIDSLHEKVQENNDLLQELLRTVRSQSRVAG